MQVKVLSGFSGGAAHKDPEPLFLVSPWLTTLLTPKGLNFLNFLSASPTKEMVSIHAFSSGWYELKKLNTWAEKTGQNYYWNNSGRVKFTQTSNLD